MQSEIEFDMFFIRFELITNIAICRFKKIQSVIFGEGKAIFILFFALDNIFHISL